MRISNRSKDMDLNKLLDELDPTPFFDEELVEPAKETLEDYLVRKRTLNLKKEED